MWPTNVGGVVAPGACLHHHAVPKKEVPINPINPCTMSWQCAHSPRWKSSIAHSIVNHFATFLAGSITPSTLHRVVFLFLFYFNIFVWTLFESANEIMLRKPIKIYWPNMVSVSTRVGTQEGGSMGSYFPHLVIILDMFWWEKTCCWWGENQISHSCGIGG